MRNVVEQARRLSRLAEKLATALERAAAEGPLRGETMPTSWPELEDAVDTACWMFGGPRNADDADIATARALVAAAERLEAIDQDQD